MKRFRPGGAIGAACGWLLVLTVLGTPNENVADYRFFDLFASRLRPQPSEEVVIVAIDDETVRKWDEPSVFWASRLAKIVKKSFESGARFVALDFVPAASVDAFLDKRGDPVDRPNTELGIVLAEHSDQVALGFRPGRSALHPSDEVVLSPEVDRKLFSIELPYSLDGRVRTFNLHGKDERRLAPCMSQMLNGTKIGSKNQVWLVPPTSGHQTVVAHLAGDMATFSTTVKDKVVFIGATAESLGDQHPVAFGEVHSGVSVHAELFQNLSEGPVASGNGWILTLCSGVGTVVLSALRSKFGFLIGALVPVGAVGAGFFALQSQSLMIGAGFSAVAGGVAMLAGWATRAAIEASERHRVESVFGIHVSQKVLDYIVANGIDSIEESPNTTVMFLDIRASSKMGESLASGELFALLNEFFESIAEPIAKKGGVINRFLGDGFLALFGAPMPSESYARNAFDAALAILSNLNDFNRNREESGLQPIRVGIGLHSGSLSQGFLGAKDRREYTVIGDTVNAASRIQDLTKTYECELVLSEETFRHLETDPGRFERHEAVELKGKLERVNVYVFRG